MADKEGGDSEKKMTKDFLDRWKKIASKYEGPEEEAAKAKEAQEGQAPTARTPPPLDKAVADLKETGGGEHEEDELELDELMVDFGLQGDEEAAAAKKAAPKPAAPAPPKAPAPAASAARAAEAPPKPVEAPKPAADDAQRRVLDTLKKVGLVKEAAPPPPPPPEPPAEEEDTLLLELENLLSEGPADKAEGTSAPAQSRATLEEEDLIAELEGLLEGGGEDEAPAPAKVPPVKPVAPPKPAEAVKAAPPPKVAEAKPVVLETKIREIAAPPAVSTRPEIVPPEAPKARAVEPGEVAGGRVNGGRVNGGRVNGGRVNGGRVNGGRVNGGRVNGGRVNGGRVNGGRVNGGRVNGGRVNGGRVNGGRVNGGRVNGGRVNGGRVNGGQTNGGRVNGSRVNGGRGGMMGGASPVIRAQGRRQMAISAMVALIVVSGLFITLPSGSGPRGPVVDGHVADWAGTGALFYSDAQDGGTLPPALDLREYAVRVDGSRLWFEAQSGAPLFTRTGAFPPRADYFLILLDTDGSSTTGYSYNGLGIDRVVDAYGWNGSLKAFGTRVWANRAGSTQDDFAGFDTAGGLQLQVRGDRIEGALTGVAPDPVGSNLANLRALFELRGSDATGTERIDSSGAPATLSGTSITATVVPIAPATLAQGQTPHAPMLNISLVNPSPTAVQVTGVRLQAEYAPTAPTDLSTVMLWNDLNGNNRLGPGEDEYNADPVPLANLAASAVPFDAPLTLAPGQQVNILAAVEHVSANAQNGSSLRLSVASSSDILVGAGTTVTLVRAPVGAGAQPLSYFGSAPATTVVDGNTLEWAARTSATDPADNAVARIDLRALQGNVTPSQASFLVTVGASPLQGALIPIKFASAIELPSLGGGGGSGGPPQVPPPTSGADLLWIMIEADNDPATGYFRAGVGYDFAIRVEGKGGQVLQGGGKVYNWSRDGTPGWVEIPQAQPEVGVGALAIEVGASLPPLVLTARNLTVTAYATDWQGARDDMAGPLVIGNSQGTRGLGVPQTPDGPLVDDGSGTVTPIPEFQEIAVPVLAVLLIAGMSRRGRRTRSVE